MASALWDFGWPSRPQAKFETANSLKGSVQLHFQKYEADETSDEGAAAEVEENANHIFNHGLFTKYKQLWCNAKQRGPMLTRNHYVRIAAVLLSNKDVSGVCLGEGAQTRDELEVKGGVSNNWADLCEKYRDMDTSLVVLNLCWITFRPTVSPQLGLGGFLPSTRPESDSQIRPDPDLSVFLPICEN